jgi:hypothetical protein
MKIINAKILELNHYFTSDDFKKILDLNLPINFSWILNKNIEKILAVVRTVEKTNKQLIDKYLEKDDNGKPIPAKDDNGEILKDKFIISNEYHQKYAELLVQENELDIETVSIKSIENYSGLTTKDIMMLSFMLTD